MIGTNNIERDFTAEQIASGVDQIVKTIHAKLPETKVLLLAIFPPARIRAKPTLKGSRNN